MKLVKQLSILFLIFLCNFLLSCSSTPEKKIDSVYVMVYDYDNSGVMDVSIFLNKELIGKTDIYGRLMFPVPTNKKQELSVSVEKEGYEKVEIKTLLNDGQVLYFKIGTAEYYAENAEILFDEGNAEKALLMIEKALEIKERNDYRYLQKIIQKGIKNEAD